jgi:Uma2 family endonuclease
MATVQTPAAPKRILPDHTQLPDRDGVPVRNSLEPWQSALLSETLDPVLQAQFPDGDFFIGQDCGIYWEHTNPPGLGCKSPDWYVVPDVPHLLDGLWRRSYVLWQELVPPLILLEYASDGGEEERDATPRRGKFWVYERRIRPAFYGIFLPEPGTIEMYHLVEDRFRRMPANAQGRFPIATLGVELGVWRGKYGDYDNPWMRWWDAQGNLLLTGKERTALALEQANLERQRAEHEKQRAEQEKQRAEQEKQRAEALAEKLRSLGVDPEAT